MRIAQTGLLYEEPERSTPGYLLIRPVDGDKTFLLDPSGDVAHVWHSHKGMTNWCYLLPNGNLFVNERCENRQGVALTASGRMSEYSPDGTLLWTHDDPFQHHDTRRLADGAIYAAFTELSEAEKAEIKGGVPGTETDGGPYGEAIRQVNEAGEVVWEWHYKELGMESHPLHRNANRWSYGHTNTVFPMKDGRFLISSKNLCLVFIINPKTGAVDWEFQSDEMGGQHDAQMLDNGNVLVFANGVYAGDLHHSQVWEIDPKSNEVVWRYKAKDNMTSFFSPHMGGAERLPSGNTLICEGSKGCIFEVTPEGDIVREFVSPYFVQSELFGSINWLFRCRWYAPDSPEISTLKSGGFVQ